MEKFFKKFERFIVLGLLGLMVLVVFLGTIELVVVLVQELLKPPKFLLDIENMLTVFGFFLIILIGLELIETMKIYLSDDSVHVEIIFLVAIIAMTRKVIILDIKSLPPLALLGVAAIILALAFGYYALKKAMKH